MTEANKSRPTVAEAGQKGWEGYQAKYTPEESKQQRADQGKKGGNVSRRSGRNYHELVRQGRFAQVGKYGREQFSEMGKKGGLANAEKGSEHFRRVAQLPRRKRTLKDLGLEGNNQHPPISKKE